METKEEQNQNGLFVTPQDELTKISWDLLNRRKRE